MQLTSLIGNTPLVRLDRIHSNPGVKLFGKLEGQNPGGSVKDRAAFYMVKSAIERGDLKKQDTIVEATSGNTGIALAMIAAYFDINIKLIMPENATVERVLAMKAYGAEVILTPSEKTIEYSRLYAEELAQKNGYIILDQFNNPDNKRAHVETTGPEVWRDTEGTVSHFISAMGTTGTITGTSTYLKEQNPQIRIIGAQPFEGSSIPGIRAWSPEMLPGIYEPDRIDEIKYVSEDNAVAASRLLAEKEGVFAGMSSGGALHIALNLIDEIKQGVIVFIICDRGDRYVSSSLFE